MSIDGQSHGDLLLMAIGSGVTAAFVILMILISLIRHKTNSEDEKECAQDTKIRHNGDFMMTTANESSDISPSLQKSNLMFKYFGKSLSSFDLERSEVASSLDMNIGDRQHYKQNIFFISDVNFNSIEDEKPSRKSKLPFDD